MAEGICAFLARVLDQLSVTPWLPAVFFDGNSAVLLVQGEESLSLPNAIASLIDLEWGAVLVSIFVVIIFVMVIQAFEFESLQT